MPRAISVHRTENKKLAATEAVFEAVLGLQIFKSKSLQKQYSYSCGNMTVDLMLSSRKMEAIRTETQAKVGANDN